jgi:hypothetical protein
MTEAEWLACEEPEVMLKVVCDRADERKIRLFALAGCRRIEPFLTTHEKNCRAAIAVLERQIEGTASESDLQTALSAMQIEMNGHVRNPAHAAGYALDTATCVLYFVGKGNWKRLTESVSEVIAYDALARSGSRDLEQIEVLWIQRASDWQREEDAVRCLPEYLVAMKVERSNQADLVRDIFGNPFRPVTFSPEWRTDTAVALARQMYEAREFSAMPILADALQDAGCDNEDVLTHCRDVKQGHVRGCWVVDLVLGK